MTRTIVTEKLCTRCKEIKPAGEFRVNTKLKSGLYSHCNTCVRAEDRARRPSKHRDPDPDLPNEVWKEIPNHPNYAASSLGRIKRITNGTGMAKAGRVLKPARHPDGYQQVALWLNNKSTSVRVHRLVAMAFLGLPPDDKPQVNHINHLRDDNRSENLEWVDNRTNYEWSRQAGRAVFGERMGRAKLRDQDIPVIRQRLLEGHTLQSIADDYGVHNTVIFHIKHGNAWTHIK